ncbi:hypothetical protein [Aquimarina algicola]|uniref:DUF4149 domain-containing protein n=1 Tax=Aquimarina algicola TaxID=2589995 RepID=A0A504J8J0_9FLAO|nr:hypothetical protein [Aquimarina algicola]TPN87216.1 hypothetical protein FHK87_06410 [Aquimarina algicola]
MKNIKEHTVTGFTFIWIGFIGAISFMEAWLKFQAPGVTKEIGLGIGQLVFGTLNKVEITFSILILLGVLFSRNLRKDKTLLILLLVPLAILMIQTLGLLPALDHRANLIIEGTEVPKSRLHLWYVILEVAKVSALIIYGIKLFKINTNENM